MADFPVQFSGLLSFTFRFRSLHDMWNGGPKVFSLKILKCKHYNYHLWLPHGLQDGIDFHEFQNVLSIQGPEGNLNYVLSRPHKAILVIHANFRPDSQYTIEFQSASNIIDGFGLPFQ